MAKRSVLIAGLVGAVAAGSIAVAVAGGAGSQVPGRNGVLSSDIAKGAVRASDLAKPKFEPIVLQNGWVPYANGTRPPKVAKDGFGFVHLRGAIRRPSGTSFVPFKLAKPYRPNVIVFLPIAVYNDNVAHMEIDPNGVVTIGSQGSASPDTFTSLEGLTYKP
jgi:hypothetical protein